MTDWLSYGSYHTTLFVTVTPKIIFSSGGKVNVVRDRGCGQWHSPTFLRAILLARECCRFKANFLQFYKFWQGAENIAVLKPISCNSTHTVTYAVFLCHLRDSNIINSSTKTIRNTKCIIQEGLTLLNEYRENTGVSVCVTSQRTSSNG
jgi:hypothetical protein